MATTWGLNSWGDNSWASNQNNVDVNGISASFSLNSVVADAEINIGWGSDLYGIETWGTSGQIAIPTGISASFNIGSLTIDAEINEGWGRITWGNNGWGILGDVGLTGQEITSNLNSVTVDAEINVGWGSDTWGTETWGASGQLVDLTGIQLSANLDSVSFTISGSTDVTGEQITSVLGDAEGFASFTQELTGLPMAMTLSFDPEIVSPTGEQLTSNLGTATLDANTIAEVSTTVPSYYGSATWGFGAWGNEPVETLAMTSDEGTVDPSPDATVTGIGFNASLAVGTVIIGEANVTVVGEGFGAALGVGNLDAVTLADVTGITMSADLGSPFIKGFANVTLTGFGLTMTEGTNRTLIWNQVNTGTAPTWKEVDTAA
jgi:hypothetical protein